MDNVKLFISHDAGAPYDKSVHALTFKWAKNLKLRNIEVFWEAPGYDQWKSALFLEDIRGLELEGFRGGPAKTGTEEAAIVLNQVEDARVSESKGSSGTSVFCEIRGERSRNVSFVGNDFLQVRVPYRLAPEVRPGVVTAAGNLVIDQ